MNTIWSNDAVMKLLEQYENKPELYDKSHNLYRNNCARVKALETLASSLQDTISVTVQELKIKIAALRGKYSAELKKRLNVSSADSLREPYWYSAMSFLRDHMNIELQPVKPIKIKVWTKEAVIKLLQEYEQHPILYNKTHELYHTFNARVNAWEALTSNMLGTISVTVQDVKEKMRLLRREYAKERKKRIQAPNLANEPYWFSRISFLDAHTLSMDQGQTFYTDKVWPREAIVKLIEEYEHQPILYDKSHDFYFIFSARDEAWESITTNMLSTITVSVQAVKKKMRTLRHKYGKLRKKRIKTPEAYLTNEPYWFSQMSFLSDHSFFTELQPCLKETENESKNESSSEDSCSASWNDDLLHQKIKAEVTQISSALPADNKYNLCLSNKDTKASKVWPVEATIKILKLYERQPVLYNRSHDLYYSHSARDKAWEAITSNMLSTISVTVEGVKKRITGLRSEYGKERKKRIRAPHVYLQKEPYWFSRMSFLNEHTYSTDPQSHKVTLPPAEITKIESTENIASTSWIENLPNHDKVEATQNGNTFHTDDSDMAIGYGDDVSYQQIKIEETQILTTTDGCDEFAYREIKVEDTKFVDAFPTYVSNTAAGCADFPDQEIKIEETHILPFQNDVQNCAEDLTEMDHLPRKRKRDSKKFRD